MWFFKSKERKALEEMHDRWKGLLATATGQLNTVTPSAGKYVHVDQFLQYVNRSWPMDEYLDALEELVDARLCDGSPVLSKFFIRESGKMDYLHGHVTVALHDTSVVEFLDSKGIALSGTSQTAAEYFSTEVRSMYISDPDSVREAIRTCQNFYKEMVRLRGELEGDPPAAYVTSGMSVRTDVFDNYRFFLTVTPEMVNTVIGELSKYGLMYMDEYREYLVGRLAKASINFDWEDGWTLKAVQYDVPTAECDIYGDFLKDLVRKNERDARNKEHEVVIKAIEAAAQKRIDEHNRIAEEKCRKLAEQLADRKKG